MNLTPHDSARLRQLMDACRANSDDLSLPEMADLAVALRDHAALRSEWESRQRTDRLVGGAMHDVGVPAGLAERILAAAAARDGERLAVAVSDAVTSEAETNAQIVGPKTSATPRTSRRRWWQYVGGVAVALMLAVALWQWWSQPPEAISASQLASEAQQWFDAAAKEASGWQPPSAGLPLAFPAQAVTAKYHAWKSLSVPKEPGMVVFDLAGIRGDGRAFLFAARTRRDYQVSGVPFTRLPATGGLSMGAWQQGDVIYVLVVDEQRTGWRLENLLRDPKLAFVPRRHP